MKKNKDIQRKRHNLGYLIATITTLLLIVILFLPQSKTLLKPGPMNTGHASLDCTACHRDAKGSLRQQLQANVQYLINNRSTLADVGYRPVISQDCLSCHSRKNDRHPIFRFNEPRFKDARDAIQPHKCISCHQEHQGVRITSKENFCSNCHKDLKLKKDPVDISHESLVKDKKWKTCLRCHDYHGNHIMASINELEKAHPQRVISEYFKGSESPYSEKKRYKANKTRKKNEK